MDGFLDNVPRGAAGDLSDDLEDSIVTKLSADPRLTEVSQDLSDEFEEQLAARFLADPALKNRVLARVRLAKERQGESAGTVKDDTPSEAEIQAADRIEQMLIDELADNPDLRREVLANLKRPGVKPLNLPPVDVPEGAGVIERSAQQADVHNERVERVHACLFPEFIREYGRWTARVQGLKLEGRGDTQEEAFNVFSDKLSGDSADAVADCASTYLARDTVFASFQPVIIVPIG